MSVRVRAATTAIDAGPVATTEANLDKKPIKDAVPQLKGEKQKVILLRFVDGFSYKEIANILKKSEGAIRVIQHRALTARWQLPRKGPNQR